MSWKDAVLKALINQLGFNIELNSTQSVGGGDINKAYHLNTSVGDFFVKKNSASRFPHMFQKEAQGLKILADADEILVPEVITFGEEDDVAFLVLKFIKSSGKSENFWDDFGKRLANLHQHTNDHFGLDHDNYIGSLHQSNRKHDNWSDFFREERLDFQVKMARDHGNAGNDTVRAFERFYRKLDEIFPVEAPSLIHGDLWGGNYMINEKGEAVIIDPAVYYGHREMDMGMSKLFGGFSADFYVAYNQQYPLENGWQERLDYCNLYPLMVHVNLFGGGYLNSVKSILRNF